MITAIAFLVLGAGIFVATETIWDKADRIVEIRLRQIRHNSNINREFGRLYSRINVFRSTFFGDDEFLRTEGRAIRVQLDSLRASVVEPHLKSLLDNLATQVDRYRARGTWINTLLAWRHGQDTDLNEFLRILEELLAERIVEVALAGGDSVYYDQLVLLLSGYRESLLEIAKLNAEENRDVVLASGPDDPPPLESELEHLALRLQTLTASEFPVARYGRHLISRVDYYRHLMRLYQLEMIQLNRQNADLETLTRQILAQMERLDEGVVAVAGQTIDDVRQAIDRTIAVVFGLLILPAFFSWHLYQKLFRDHIQAPMNQVSQRLNDFHNGDHAALMKLDRHDEWAGIEDVFNRMVVALRDNVAALRDSEKRYREIFTNTTEGIFRVTLDGRFVELNPAAVNMLGCGSVEEAKAYFVDVGRQLYHDPQVYEEMIERLHEQGTVLNQEALMRRKNGALFWGIVSSYLIRDEDSDVLYLEGTVRDISERHQALESLRQMKVHLQNIIDSMPSLLICLDHDMKVSLWNKKAARENAIVENNAKGRPLHEVCTLFEPDCYLAELQNTLATRQPSRVSKIESGRKASDGHSRYFDLLIYPLSQSENYGVVIHVDEVTERVRFEEQMVRSEKMRSVGSLASGLAHEINNPLAAILQNVQVLTRRLSPDLSQNKVIAEELGTSMDVVSEYVKRRGCKQMLQAIAESGQRAARIVANVQSFSRNDDVPFVSCSLAELIERTLDLASSDYDMRHHYNFQNIRIVREFDAVPSVSCEMSQIQQVLLILFKNAAQAMTRHSAAPRLTVRLNRVDRGHVRIQVEDNGQGMDAENCRQIFDPFYTTLDVGSGSGLGLSIAYFIVTQTHGGNLSVSSAEGRGTCFDIVLPVHH